MILQDQTTNEAVPPKDDDGQLRSFETGATRDTATGKPDMDGFTHPMVMKQFAKYMTMNQVQSDGKLRSSDNWQKGIPKKAYMKSLRRHYDEAWEEWKGFPTEQGMIASLCGVMFNAMGMLLETLKDREFKLQDFDDTEPTPEMARRLTKTSTNRPDPSSAPGEDLPPCLSCGDRKCEDCFNKHECVQVCRECKHYCDCTTGSIESSLS